MNAWARGQTQDLVIFFLDCSAFDHSATAPGPLKICQVT